MTVSREAESRDPRTARALGELLRRPRYEVLALPGTADQVLEHVPREVTVTVTVSAHRGLEPTVALSEQLTQAGFTAVPHLAARMVRDGQHLAELVARLDEAGIYEVFVVGGDADPPVGEFSEATQVLGAAGGHRLTGVAAYPEGHPKIGDRELDRALLAKRPMCGYAVTQMCFDAVAVRRWLRHARDIGFDRPVHVGIPGPVDTLRLAKVATRIGVGPSLRYALKQRGSAKLLRPGGYRPDRLLAEVAGAGVAGLHVYTLGDVSATERWRQRTLGHLAHA
ncbi:methylenetetrahydrofolate reductase [Nocardioides sp. InS609-2]|uniref:methylenetetrahydrofolate reductase n=1 Tax=Nocardioides sp. InS609-2 TaxID=2760705 RepID=UPI0020BFCF11|nr:methylenetetrahydrofolate reductase [Nocardioides sp. InS609-2]